MIENTEYTIQDLELSDESFLWEMLYQAIFVAPHEQPLSRDILQSQKIARYVKEWGKQGDIGFKVLLNTYNTPAGAIWVRNFTQKNKGYGFVDDNTPELSMSVTQGFRGKGLGTLLLKRLFSRLTEEGIKFVSLSVSLANPARRLYQRLDFTDIGTEYDDSITMIRKLY